MTITDVLVTQTGGSSTTRWYCWGDLTGNWPQRYQRSRYPYAVNNSLYRSVFDGVSLPDLTPNGLDSDGGSIQYYSQRDNTDALNDDAGFFTQYRDVDQYSSALGDHFLAILDRHGLSSTGGCFAVPTNLAGAIGSALWKEPTHMTRTGTYTTFPSFPTGIFKHRLLSTDVPARDDVVAILNVQNLYEGANVDIPPERIFMGMKKDGTTVRLLQGFGNVSASRTDTFYDKTTGDLYANVLPTAQGTANPTRGQTIYGHPPTVWFWNASTGQPAVAFNIIMELFRGNTLIQTVNVASGTIAGPYFNAYSVPTTDVTGSTHYRIRETAGSDGVLRLKGPVDTLAYARSAVPAAYGGAYIPGWAVKVRSG